MEKYRIRAAVLCFSPSTLSALSTSHALDCPERNKDQGRITGARSGFTLLELMVVLAIMSMISALVTPVLIGSLSKMTGRTEAQKIAASLRHARSRAVSEKKLYLSVFDMKAGRLTIREHLDADKEPENDPAAPLIYDFPPEVHLEKGESQTAGVRDADTFRIAFFPSGGSSGGEITLMDERDRRHVISVDIITGNVLLK